MRTFTLGSGAGCKVVGLEAEGSSVFVIETRADGRSQKSERKLASEGQARAAIEKMARELIGRGFVEKDAAIAQAPTNGRGSKPSSRHAAPGLGDVDLRNVYDEDDLAPAPALPRLAPAPAAEAAPRKKKKKKAGRANAAQPSSNEGLDKRVLLGAGAFGALLLAFVAYLGYDIFLKPASIVGTWKGSRLEYEIGRAMTYNQYLLVLDGSKRASLTLQEGFTSVGTYTIQGDQLILNFGGDAGKATKGGKAAAKGDKVAAQGGGEGVAKGGEDEGDDGEGEAGGEGEGGGDEFEGPSELRYKIALGHTTLDLFDPTTGKKMVQLVRMSENKSVGGKDTQPREAPKDLAASAAGKVDKDADARLASVEFAAKDGAFRARHPAGWEATTGARSDNSYSWVKFIKGSAKIQILADVQGSLMSGSDFNRGQQEEGSLMAPVHSAHELYARHAAEDFNDYKETEPTLFKGSRLGEGRVSAFTASAGGLLGGKLRGYRVTLLTNNRRVTILCECPDGQFDSLKSTFLAVARSVSP